MFAMSAASVAAVRAPCASASARAQPAVVARAPVAPQHARFASVSLDAKAARAAHTATRLRQVTTRASRQNRSSFAVIASEEVTVADTKRKFLEAYPYPIPSIWGTIIGELLVQQHFIKYNARYSYNKLASLGFVSVFDQLLEGFPSDESKEEIFQCFLKSLGEDPAQTRADATELATFASGAGSADGLAANEIFATMKAQNEGKTFLYSKFIAIGMFRMLELAKATEPAALESLAGAGGIALSKVNSDLGMYKGMLSKLSAAKELQAEYLEREKRKTAERLAKKAEKAAAAADASTPEAEA